MKTCKSCGEAKPLNEFYAHPQTRDRRQQNCIVCVKAYTAAYKKRNSARAKEWNRAYYAKRVAGRRSDELS